MAFVGTFATDVYDRSGTLVARRSPVVADYHDVGLARDSVIVGPDRRLGSVRRYREQRPHPGAERGRLRRRHGRFGLVGAVVDASLSHVIVNGTNPARQYIVDVGHSRYTSRSVTGAGLWSKTLWSAAPGKLQPQNLRTDVLGAAVATGSACTATEVRATARFLCWSCGVQGPAGVFDLTRKVNTALPASPYLLGDNFLVHHDESGSLVRRDLGDGSTATPATFPRGDTADDRNVTWTVDKFGGDVAYADEQGAVHVIDPGTRPSAPAGGIVDASSRLGFGQYQGWAGSINATRPLDSWKLRIARVARTARMTSSCATAPAPCSASSATARAASARSSLSVPAIRSTRLTTDLC